jgi:enterochelin esterase family protein
MKGLLRPGPGSRLAIERLEAKQPLTSEDVDAFLEANTFPLVEERNATFVYRGDAERVCLKHWIYGLPSSQPFRRLAETDLWVLVLELPESSRVEYKLEVEQDGNTRWIEDPLNPHRANDPFGANSVVHGTGYEVPEWTQPDPEARPGTLEELPILSGAFRDFRRVTLYFPARMRRSRRYPLLVVHDGGDYLRYSGLKTVLDNLIHRLEIPEMIVALTYPRERLSEYGCSDAHARFLSEELVPRLEAALPVSPRPQDRCLMGSSFGAVACLHAAWRNPGFWGRLMLQSGSFAFTDIGPNPRGPVFEPVVRFINSYRSKPTKVAERVFVSCGTYEGLIYENRSLVPLLQSTGMEVRYVESRDGHNWENWRDRQREGLSWLFPGPLWMVYE